LAYLPMSGAPGGAAGARGPSRPENQPAGTGTNKRCRWLGGPSSAPRTTEGGHRVIPARALGIARPGNDLEEGGRSAKRVCIECAVGQEDQSRPAHDENVGSLVDESAQFELFGRHKARRAEHASHVVAERGPSVHVEVHDPEALRREIVD